MAGRRSDDITLPPPSVSHADVQPAVEDRSYIAFFAGALIMALGGGFLLAVILSLLLAGRIDFSQDSIRLTQAHGWAQLQGWAGLFVAGMGLRLIPRFAGRKPLSNRLNLAIFALLFLAAAGRTAAQSHGRGGFAGASLLASNLVGAAGVAAVAAVLMVTLAKGRKRPEAWRYFAWAGAGWWAIWAVLMVYSGFKARDDAVVPFTLDDTTAWVVMLGAVGNFIWSVQSRSVPVFFGRRQPGPRPLLAPGLIYNAGIAVILVAWLADNDVPPVRLASAGFQAAGVGLAWLAPVAGAVWGSPVRLRPSARPAARFVLWANFAGAVAGLFLALHGIASLVSGEPELFELRDAARHAIGLGLITALIFGMAQLVAPVFALQRAQEHGETLLHRFAFWGLAAALVLRVAPPALLDTMEFDQRMDLAATAGVLAWLAILAFAVMVVRAVQQEPAMKELLAAPLRNPR